MWLTVSFWWNAFEQRQDALQLQALNSIEDNLFDLADALGQERSHIVKLLSIDINDDVAQERYAISVSESDRLLRETLQTMSLNTMPLLPSSHGSQIKGYLDSNRKSLEQINEDLLSLRAEFIDQSLHDLSPFTANNAIAHFEQYSYLINAVGMVRRDIQFTPSNTSVKAQHHAQFIDSIWVLKESNLQATVLLENMLFNFENSHSVIDIQSHRLLLQKLNYRTALAVEEIRTLGRRYQFSESIELTMKWEAEQYLDEYLVLSESLVERLSDGSVTTQELRHWIRSLDELHAFAHHLRTESTKFTLAEISDVQRKATTNLIIDTFLLVLCVAMAVFSLRYFRRMHYLANHDELS